jgi:23S rRNA (adenine2503-C2)-methyltransferase
MLPSLTGQSPETLAIWLKGAAEPAFRTAQILEWVWKKKVTSYEAMSNLY